MSAAVSKTEPEGLTVIKRTSPQSEHSLNSLPRVLVTSDSAPGAGPPAMRRDGQAEELTGKDPKRKAGADEVSDGAEKHLSGRAEGAKA
mmetsp:Transcript_22807/g.35717  ORF Transcript_22807/g.35717 Transcript_22807/m.35717 type:complete len:89 (-) Transcript_22807:279-545(-)